MSDLFSSLRSLLPQEYIRGGSSTSDNLEEATKYIRDLEKSIKQLSDKRDKLKITSSTNVNDDQHDDPAGSSSSISATNRTISENNYVTIHNYPKRLEIEVSVKVGEGNVFALSKMLKQVSFEQGLEVVSCVSSQVDDIWKCIIHCDVIDDGPTVNLSDLQRRLASEMSSYVG